MFAKWIDKDGRFSFAEDDNGGCEITDDEHAKLMAGQSSGKVITADADGFPMLSDQPAQTSRELLANNQAKAKACLAKSDITVLRCYEAGISVPPEWVEYRKALRAFIGTIEDPKVSLPQQPIFPIGT